jgi:hypothetical protein
MKFTYIIPIVLGLILAGCTSLSRYDDQTYKSMTSLKGEVRVFMDDCATKGTAGASAAASLEGFRVKLSQAYEYEAGKTKNSETISQMKTLSEIFDEAYNRFTNNKMEDGVCISRKDGETAESATGCLSMGYCKGKSKVLENAFDIAISTEALKNK